MVRWKRHSFVWDVVSDNPCAFRFFRLCKRKGPGPLKCWTVSKERSYSLTRTLPVHVVEANANKQVSVKTLDGEGARNVERQLLEGHQNRSLRDAIEHEVIFIDFSVDRVHSSVGQCIGLQAN